MLYAIYNVKNKVIKNKKVKKFKDRKREDFMHNQKGASRLLFKF